MSNRLPTDAGLTILELMIVLVILSLIGTVVAVQVVGQMDRAKVDVAALQLRQIQNALTLFELDTHSYPSGTEGLLALVEAPQDLDGWRGPYMKSATHMEDPWGTAVAYEISSDNAYQLTSLGADRKKGGEGTSADILIGAAE